MKHTPLNADDITASVLKARADILAGLNLSWGPRRNRLTVIEFGISHEVYAVPLTHARTIQPLKHLTYIPGAPGFIKGVFNLRGEIISVVDLKYFFDLPDLPAEDSRQVIILSSEDMEFGILSDVIHGVTEIDADDIQTSLPTISGIRQEYIKGVTPTGIAVLDDEKLLNDPKMIISL